MLPFTIDKSKCTGCTACYSICPKQCIEMKADEEGFLYPIASDFCIHCNKCEHVCPIQNAEHLTPVNTFEKRAYAAVSKEYHVWKRSASGGAFSEICRAWSDKETLIVGASFDGLKVHHICVYGYAQIAPLCKSKYVASSLDNTFVSIKKHINNGKKAIFCGTPCQVAGLRSFLNKDYENILLIDLICHGVGSPSVFNSSLNAIGNQFEKSVLSYEFRSKRYCYETDYLNRVFFEDETTIYLSNDQYMQLFLSQKCLRPSCGRNCLYRNENRQGDITIADFKGLKEVFPSLLGTKKNYSSIIINTKKGNEILNILNYNMRILPCSLDNIRKYNPLFSHQTYFSEDRDIFFKDYIFNSDKAIHKWTNPATIFVISLKRRLLNVMPSFIRCLLYNIRGMINNGN